MAAGVALRGLLSPQNTIAVRRDAIEGLADGDLVQAEAVELKRTLIRTYGEEVVAEEARNSRKLDVVNRAGLLLLIGVFALAGEGATLAVQHVAAPKNPTPSNSPRPTAKPGEQRPKPPAKLPVGTIKKGNRDSPSTK